ncbi:hypothetical protein CBR_g17584 [Chara braunii]|uniref:Reverse transcriptase domain-containing protein n=1 Tax=Chara braunii TaxID=69332 RepID=A0A388KV61_CHABU|nr:hypothetical protein CBR_g17584 [Chara braunii]|eukprot:GBG73872.1 hypothetical protein CBR_g17584 [Chara braunii]
MVDMRSGRSTSPYTAEQEAKTAALLKEKREKKKAKKRALLEEQAAKMRKIEEEMAREKERLKREEEEKLKAVEEGKEEDEQPLERRRAGGRGESSRTKEDQMEKKITEWVAGLSLGEEEEAQMYVPKEEKEAAMREWDVEEDPLKRQTMEDEKIMARNIERRAQVQEEQYLFGRGQDIALRSIRLGLRDFARELTTQVGSEPNEEKPIDPAIAKLLEEFTDLAKPPTGVVPRPIQHRIEIEPGSMTPEGAVYRMSPRELEELRKQLDELLEKGWIRPISSPFRAPVVFVPKKEGELRMCIDYRGLNAITMKNAAPLPRIDDLLDRVQGCKYFSKIDLKSGYHQIEVHPDDQYKTAFRTKYGHYEFIVMPFGLTNAPATFQRCMNDLFRPWLNKFVVVYLDDILVFSRTLQEHEGHLRQVLEKLREVNFKINAKKCEWAKTQVLYLGHVLDGDDIKPEDSKIAAIRDWPIPRTLIKLRSFLGLANYYRKFVRNFSTIVAPLHRLLKKETIWKWNKDCTSAMKKLKQALIEYPILKVADPSLPFVVTTDASQYGIGDMLHQDDGNGYRPVEFMSARMPSEKLATSTYLREGTLRSQASFRTLEALLAWEAL